MANIIFDAYKELVLGAGLNLSTLDIRLILLDAADHTFNAATDDFLDDIASGARVATSAALTSKTVTDGDFDAADVTLSTVTGDQSEGVLWYRHTGTESTSNLLWYIDTGVTGLPITPNGNDIDLVFNASGIISPMG